ncbi:histidine ammonia-lyase [Rhizobium sp. BK529]|uniref:hypothetical protein n=1 Tax=Rhizobium sp. BK529 TaxID=2586983 RepID=UPI00161AA837|nr:hypothetical protein [Rhizobium sp. BK529]MBB3594901.1 histidine ammonia-lyase [Rhizobium sp. BK529]
MRRCVVQRPRDGRHVLDLLALAVVAAGLTGCGVTGADPTGTAAMAQFEAHRQQSMAMQRQATSAEAADEREANMRSAIQFCRQHPEVQGCTDVVRDEAQTMETMRKMRSIGTR